MEIIKVAEHYVAISELRSPANILDLGARDFNFTRYFDARGDYVLPVDIDPSLGNERPYLNYAVSNFNGICGIKRTADAQATRMTRTISGNIENAECVTLERLLEITTVPYFDLIKMDIEGAEYEVIMSLTKAPAKQISCEFHIHTGAYSQPDVAIMVAKLHSLGYKTVTHELTNQHGAGLNFWSSLFIR